MKRIGIIANCEKDRAAEVLDQLGRCAGSFGLSLVAAGGASRHLRDARRVKESEVTRRVDALMALGGDGTMLRAVRLLDGRNVPVIGVNIGSLGFLTSVAERDLRRAMRCLADDSFMTSTRSIIECRVKRGRKTVSSHRALNDVVVHNAESARVVTLEVAIDGRNISPYVCDGLILATPTGSTGHSLSAGGPVLAPETCAFVVTAICPHTLASRPLVIPDTGTMTIRIGGENVSLPSLSVDGQVDRALRKGEHVEIRRSRRSVRFIHLPGYSYFDVLRHKLHWRGSSV